MVVCHALTGNSRLDQWWGMMLGPGKVFDTDKYFIVCANILGSCYGSTGPLSINPETNQPYGKNFPKVTIRDSVRLHIKILLECFFIDKVHCVVGGSLGWYLSISSIFYKTFFLIFLFRWNAVVRMDIVS